MATATKKTTTRKTVKAAPKKASKNVAADAFASFENMSNANRDQFETFVAAMTENADTMRDQAEEIFETCRDSLETAGEQMRTVNADLIEAAREETAEAVEFVTELARAKTVADALELQRDYWSKLFETRMKRARDLTQTSVEAARASFEPLSKTMTAFPTANFQKIFPFVVE